MSRCLSKIEDTFLIKGRGLVFTPGIVPIEGENHRIGDPLLLVRPDGARIDTVIAGLELSCPNPRHEFCVLLKGLTKDDVPIGSEVWSVDADECRNARP